MHNPLPAKLQALVCSCLGPEKTAYVNDLIDWTMKEGDMHMTSYFIHVAPMTHFIIECVENIRRSEWQCGVVI